MRYTRIYNEDDGSTRIETSEIMFARAMFAPPAPPLDVSSAMKASEMVFIVLPKGWTDAAHPAPARQWMLCLSGRGEVTAGGVTKEWGPGDVFLLEDTAPPGHASTAHEDSIYAVIRL